MAESDKDPGKPWLLQALCDMYQTGKYCDVNIQIEDQTFTCHKVILSAASSYFDAMFSSDMTESRTSEAILHDIEATAFKDVLAFVYKERKDVINTENAESLLKTACILQISFLQAQCEDFLIRQLCCDNCVGLWVIAKMYTCQSLQNDSWLYLLSNFERIWQHEEFLLLEADDLVCIIKDNGLHVSSEEIVCKAVLKWLYADLENRKSSVEKIFGYLRLSQMSMDFLLDELDEHPCVRNSDTCQRRVKDALRYHALPDRRHTYDVVDSEYRDNSGTFPYTVVLIKKQSTEHTLTDLIAYCPRTKKWYTPTSLPIETGDDFATCPYGDDIFLSGGTAQPSAVLRFSAKMCRWTRRIPMPTGRTRHSMVAVQDSLYCLGGTNHGALTTVDEFDLTTETWRTVGALSKAVYYSSAAVLKNKIYMFGGCRGFDYSSAIQCFDTITKNCTIVAKFPSPIKGAQALAASNNIYVVCETGDVYEFADENRVEELTTISDFRYQNFAVHRDRNTLFVLGGVQTCDDDLQEDIKVSDHIRAVNISDDTSDVALTLPSQLPSRMQIHGCYRTVIRRKYPFTEIGEQFD